MIHNNPMLVSKSKQLVQNTKTSKNENINNKTVTNKAILRIQTRFICIGMFILTIIVTSVTVPIFILQSTSNILPPPPSPHIPPLKPPPSHPPLSPYPRSPSPLSPPPSPILPPLPDLPPPSPCLPSPTLPPLLPPSSPPSPPLVPPPLVDTIQFTKADMSILTGRCIYIETDTNNNHLYYRDKDGCRQRAAELATTSTNISAIAYFEYDNVVRIGFCMLLTNIVHQQFNATFDFNITLYYHQIRDEEGYSISVPPTSRINRYIGSRPVYTANLFILNYTQTTTKFTDGILVVLPGFEKANELYC